MTTRSILYMDSIGITRLRAWLHCLYNQKILRFVCDLIYVVIVSSSTFYSSELTKFEQLSTIAEYNCVYFSQLLEC